MAGPAERSALAALDVARPVVARLDAARDPEDLAADLIESWNAVETALRSLVGGSSVTGQALIRELRQRQLISLEQANSLAEFQAARDRAQRTAYRPTAGDIAAARDGFLKIESALMLAVKPPPPGAAPTLEATRRMASGEASGASPRRAIPWRLLAIVAAVLLIGLGAWYALQGRGGDNDLREGRKLLAQGKREVARDVFKKAARDDPKSGLALVYVGRMFREEQRFDSAQIYLNTAIRREPSLGVAHREYAKLLFLQGNYVGARDFFRRAITADGTDRESLGYLGCTLLRMGAQPDVALRFIQRAGRGPWEACAAQGPPAGMPMGAPPA